MESLFQYVDIEREIPLQGNTRRPAMKIVEGKGPGSLRLYNVSDELFVGN
jgi:hypothetical protein